MTVSLRGTSSISTGTAYSVAVPMPTGTVQGDVVIVAVACSSTVTFSAAPSGWTQITPQGGTGPYLIAYARVMPASPPTSVTVDWTAGGIASSSVAVAAGYSGVNNAAMLDGINSSVNTNPSSAMTLTTGHATAELVGISADLSATSLSTPAGYTKEVQMLAGLVIALYDQVAGAAGSYTFTTPTASHAAIFLSLNAQAPPLAPTLTTPINASYVDLAAGQSFFWKYNPATSAVTQTAYALRRKIGAGAYEWWNAGTLAWQGTEIFNTSGSNSVVFGSGKWANGTTYNWSVNTQDSNGTGTYSADNTVTGSVAPTVTATAPTGTVAGSTPSVTWTETVQAGASQTAYRVVVETGAYGSSPGLGTVVWDSGVVGSAALSATVGAVLANNTGYRAFVQVTETGGQTSPWSFVTFTITYNTPATPSLIAVWDSTLARAALTVQGYDNLLTLNQSSFETDTSGWAAGTNTTIARSTAQFIDGTASLSLTSVAAGDIQATTTTGTGGRPVIPGKVYTAVASFRSAVASRAVNVRIVWYDVTGASISTATGASTADNLSAFQQATVTAQAPATAAFAAVVVYVVGTSAASEVHYVDRIGLAPDLLGNLVLNPDFESNTTSWTATAVTLTVDTTQTYTGRSSMKMVATGSGAVATSAVINSVPGTVLTASAYGIQPSGATSWNLRVINTSGGAQVGSTSPIAATTPWARSTVTFTVPASGQVQVQVILASGTTGTIFIDAVQVVVGSTAPTYTPPSYSNLVQNPGFELDATNWSVGNANSAVARSTAAAFAGSASLAVTSIAAGDIVAYEGGGAMVSGGVTYTASVYYRAATVGRTVQTQIQFYDVVGNFLSQVNGNSFVDTTTGWTRATVTATAPANAAQVAVIPKIFATGAAGEVHYVDAVQLEAGTIANPYVDGTQGPGNSWDVTPNMLSAAAASFEDASTGGWTAGTNWSRANSTAQAFDGTHSLLLTRLNTTAGNGTVTSPTFPVVAGVTYTASVWVRASAGTSYTLVYVDPSAARTTVTFTAAAGSWVRALNTFTATTSGNATILLTDDSNATPTNGSTIYLDAVQVEQRGYATWYGITVPTASNATSTHQQAWTVGGFAATGSYIIEASEDNGVTWKGIRGSGTLVVNSAADQQIAAYDYERTPGVTTLYRARVSDGAGSSLVSSANSPTASVTSVYTSWWVKNVTNPALNIAICDAQQHVRNRKGDSVAIYPAGRTNPLVLRGPVHGADGQMRTVVSTEVDRTSVLNTFTALASMLLQDPRGRQWYAEWVGDLTETQVQTDPTQPIYAIQRNWVEVDVPG